jgi:chaperonin GroES
MKKVEPLDDRVLVRPTDAAETTKGGIVIPDQAREKSYEGIVVAVGQGKKRESGGRAPISVSAEDTVLYSKYAGTEIKIDGQDHVILREGDLVAKITEV